MNDAIDAGTKVYKAYIAANPETHWIDEGTVTEIVADGVPFVRTGSVLVPLSERWHLTRAGAKREAHVALVRHIGLLQKKADEISDEILHESLTKEEAAA